MGYDCRHGCFVLSDTNSVLSQPDQIGMMFRTKSFLFSELRFDFTSIAAILQVIGDYVHVLVRSFPKCPCVGPATEKNFRGIINPEKGFMTAKSVYQRALPFDKPFFLKKVGKGLSPVAN